MDVSSLVQILVILLLVATSVAIVSRWLRVSYVIGLVLAGLAITELLPQPIRLNDSLILDLFLPILLFEAAINTNISSLRSTFKPISLLAGPGVIIASGITAIILKWGLGLSWIPACLAGIILAITDTVSVIAVFKETPVPPRLATIVEGESLLNDGVALVLFGLILEINKTGSLNILQGLQEFFVVIVGGSLIGIALGYLAAGLFVRSDESLSITLLSVALALGAFQVAHSVGVSGVIAVVVAGLIVESIGLSEKISASTGLSLFSFWESLGFIVNSFIFLLIGLEVDLITFFQTLPGILLAILAYQCGRILSVYPLLAIVRYIDIPVPLPWQHILFFGNIKGSLSMALALTIPTSIPGREKIIALVFGSVLLSLIGQGLTLPWFVKRLQLTESSESSEEIEQWQVELMTAKAAQDELQSLLKSGLLPEAIYEEMRASYQVKVAAAEKALREIYNRGLDDSGFSKLDAVRRRLLLVEKGAVNDAIRKKIISEKIVEERLKSLDQQILTLGD